MPATKKSTGNCAQSFPFFVVIENRTFCRTPDQTNGLNAQAPRSICSTLHALFTDHASCSEISSKDAYMLIYARREPAKTEQEGAPNITPLDLLPSPDVMEVVNSLNATHDEECETFSIKYTPLSTCNHITDVLITNL